MKRFKKAFVLIISMLLLFNVSITVLASTVGSIDRKDIQYIDTGSLIGEKTIGITPYGGISVPLVVCTVQSTSTVYEKFVKYLTASWAKASNYTWSTSVATSYSISGSYTASVKNAIEAQVVSTFSYTTNYGVGIDIPADPSRYSKLGFFSDYKRSYVETNSTDYYTKITTTTYNYVYEPKTNTYLNVVYY